MRIAKFISHSGYCSRRDADKLIFKNKVKINSVVCNNPATKILKTDLVTINNKKFELQIKIRIWKFNKPIGIISSKKDEIGRKTIFNLLPKSLLNIISIGRLDINSEGLILLTNNGDLARHFELPKSNFERVYKVRIQGKVDKIKLKELEKGIMVDKIKYKPIYAKLLKQMGSNAWIEMKLTEGKNREIRKICSSYGWRVNRLIRIKFGEFHIGNLKPGNIKEIKKHNYNDKDYWR